MIPKKSGSILIVTSESDISELFAQMLLMGDHAYIINAANTGKDVSRQWNEILLTLFCSI